MVVIPEVATVLEVPDYIRGPHQVVRQVLPVLDVRKRIGFSSAVEKTRRFLCLPAQRDQADRKWLNELELWVKQGRPFTLATGPH